MLSSLMSDGGVPHRQTHRRHHHHHHHHHPSPQPCPISSPAHARQLLIRCAELVYRGDLPAADRAISILSAAAAAASPYGDASDRLVLQFCRALSVRIGRAKPAAAADASSQASFLSSYLLFNQVAPFLRFAHLTANQAILEAVDGRRRVHILDFDAYFGLQWPPLLQAIADQGGDPPFVRITCAGSDLETLQRTGDRLQNFARSLGLEFKFHPLLLPRRSANSMSLNAVIPSCFQFHPSETLAVNCVLFLHKMESEGAELRSFLQAVRALNPAVVTVAEREATGPNQPGFMQRFVETVDYYAAVFDSLEATLPPTSKERMAVEQVWLGREIEGVLCGGELVCDEVSKAERQDERPAERWEEVMRNAGFSGLPPSSFAVAQGRMLLRLHYPSEGYKLDLVRDSFLLGWQEKPLFSVSSWH